MISIYFKNIRFDNELILDSVCGDVEFKVEGHSEFGIKGNDIVCAAVSVLVETSIISINRVAGIHQRIEQRDGLLRSVVEIRDEKEEKIEALRIILSTMIIGLNEIVKGYPDRVEIHFE